MNALSLVVKFAVLALGLTFASGTVKDVVLGAFDSVSIQAAHVQMEQLHGKLMEYYTANGTLSLESERVVGVCGKGIRCAHSESLARSLENIVLFFD